MMTIPISGIVDRLFNASSQHDWMYHVVGGFVMVFAVMM